MLENFLTSLHTLQISHLFQRIHDLSPAPEQRRHRFNVSEEWLPVELKELDLQVTWPAPVCITSPAPCLVAPLGCYNQLWVGWSLFCSFVIISFFPFCNHFESFFYLLYQCYHRLFLMIITFEAVRRNPQLTLPGYHTEAIDNYWYLIIIFNVKRRHTAALVLLGHGGGYLAVVFS